MKIISKCKDYYDGAVALGIDNTLIYKRKSELISIVELEGYDSFIRDKPDTFELDRINIDINNYYTTKNYINFKEAIIGFCGKLYPAFEFQLIKGEKEIKKNVFYTAIEVDEYLGQLENKYKNITYGNMYNYRLKRPTVKELDFYLKSNLFKKEYINWFQLINSPIFKLCEDPNKPQFVYAKNTSYLKSKIFIEKNPNLKNLEFYRIKDSYTVFQSIGQFLSGVLTNTEVNESTLNDKQKVRQHGFDEKYGFRTRPKNK